MTAILRHPMTYKVSAKLAPTGVFGELIENLLEPVFSRNPPSIHDKIEFISQDSKIIFDISRIICKQSFSGQSIFFCGCNLKTDFGLFYFVEFKTDFDISEQNHIVLIDKTKKTEIPPFAESADIFSDLN